MITLKEVLEIPSVSGMEDLVVDFIVKFCKRHKFKYKVDLHKNVYVTKGKIKKNEYYPCVVAHTDTVHIDQSEMIKNNHKITINEEKFGDKTKLFGWDPNKNQPTGIGGDDKCGVYMCLKMLLEFDTIKAAFFSKEEIGMQGSKYSDKKFFKNVGYAIQFDVPTRNWFTKTLMGKNLWTDEFLGDIQILLENYNIDNFSKDPFTDVLQLVQKFDFCCSVFPTGYYNQHSKFEYVIPEETEECLQLGREALIVLGLKKYKLTVENLYK